MSNKLIILGADHGGFLLKNEIREYLKQNGYTVEDLGTNSADSVNYANIAAEVSHEVAARGATGILVCGTGIGMSIAANKVKGIRAAVCSEYFSAKYTRLHNDANILCLGARVLGSGLALELVDVFLNTEFEGGRHVERIACISKIEDEEHIG
ncbi:MAG: ribose 5-phosphate isomerase B [Oscillospiraceae bacterium]|jgi:ribose 5-phosphate isomerase B|nr:ribose 5-phosphate isomerase B [Oscillospiraceae bacterium]